MAVHLSDLPKPLQDRLKSQVPTPGTRERRPRGPRPPAPGYRCNCGQEFASYGRWESHSDATGHSRGAMILS